MRVSSSSRGGGITFLYKLLCSCGYVDAVKCESKAMLVGCNAGITAVDIDLDVSHIQCFRIQGWPKNRPFLKFATYVCDDVERHSVYKMFIFLSGVWLLSCMSPY